MSNTFQDFDLMKEFLDSEYYRKAVEQFKASKEPKKPLFTTADGVALQENELCWIVDKYFKLLDEPDKVTEFSINYYSNCLLFSTREAAQEYIENNKPVLSLNDVKEALLKGLDDSPIYHLLKSELTTLVKSKLNS